MNKVYKISDKKLAKYFAFQNVLLNTRPITIPPALFAFLNSAKEHNYFEYSYINQQIFFHKHTILAVSGDYRDKICPDVGGIGFDVSGIWLDVDGIGFDVSGIWLDVDRIGFDVDGIGVDVDGKRYCLAKINN